MKTHTPRRSPTSREARKKVADPRAAIDHCSSLLDDPAGKLSEAERGEIHFYRGWARRLTGSLAEAEQDLATALRYALKLNDSSLVADVAMQLGPLYIDSHRPRDAAHSLRRAAEAFRHLGRLQEEAQALFTLGNALWEAGEREQARTPMHESLEKFAAVHSDEGMVAVHCGLANMLIDERHYDKALEQLNLCLKILPEQSHAKNRVLLDLQLAICYSKLGRIDHARAVFKSVVRRAEESGFNLQQALALYHLCQDFTERGEHAEAKRCLDEARGLSVSHGFEAAFEGYVKRHD